MTKGILTYNDVRIIIISRSIGRLAVESHHSCPRREALVLAELPELLSGDITSPYLLNLNNEIDFVFKGNLFSVSSSNCIGLNFSIDVELFASTASHCLTHVDLLLI